MEESGDIDVAGQITLMKSLTLTTGALHAWQLAQLKNYLAFVFDCEFKEASIGYDHKDHWISFYVTLSKGQKVPSKNLFLKKCKVIERWTKELFWNTMKIKIIRGKTELYSSEEIKKKQKNTDIDKNI